MLAVIVHRAVWFVAAVGQDHLPASGLSHDRDATESWRLGLGGGRALSRLSRSAGVPGHGGRRVSAAVRVTVTVPTGTQWQAPLPGGRATALDEGGMHWHQLHARPHGGHGNWCARSLSVGGVHRG